MIRFWVLIFISIIGISLTTFFFIPTFTQFKNAFIANYNQSLNPQLINFLNFLLDYFPIILFMFLAFLVFIYAHQNE